MGVIVIDTYIPLAKAGTAKVIAARETGKVEAAIVGDSAGSQGRPVEALLLVLVTLVGGTAGTGVGLIRAPGLEQQD